MHFYLGPAYQRLAAAIDHGDDDYHVTSLLETAVLVAATKSGWVQSLRQTTARALAAAARALAVAELRVAGMRRHSLVVWLMVVLSPLAAQRTPPSAVPWATPWAGQ